MQCNPKNGKLYITILFVSINIQLNKNLPLHTTIKPAS